MGRTVRGPTFAESQRVCEKLPRDVDRMHCCGGDEKKKGRGKIWGAKPFIVHLGRVPTVSGGIAQTLNRVNKGDPASKEEGSYHGLINNQKTAPNSRLQSVQS